MEINRSNILEIVNKSNAKPDKDYGQNFLIEPEICKRIIALLEIDKIDNVLEIGPGLGSLTNFLCQSDANITAVDIDRRMIDFLKLSLCDYSNITLINNDIRKVPVETYNKVIANLPYNITTETIVYLLRNAIHANKIVLMCQSETFAHFNDVSGKEYGPVSVLIHLIGTIKKAFVVKAGSFYPVPKCHSTVFVIDLNREKDFNQAIKTHEIAKQLFLNRRKTILNNLTNYLGSKDKAVAVLNELNIQQNTRPEEIKPEQYYELSQIID